MAKEQTMKLPTEVLNKVTQGAKDQINVIAKNYKLIEQRFADNAEILDEHSKALITIYQALEAQHTLLNRIALKVGVHESAIKELPKPLTNMELEK